MEQIVIKLGAGMTFEKLAARNKRKLYSLVMAEMGKKGGGRSTPAKREAALKREAKKRGE
jgi:hypothetical protein